MAKASVVPRLSALGAWRRIPDVASSRAVSFVALTVGAVVWELVGSLGIPFFPPFSAVVGRLVELTVNGTILDPLLTSLTNLAIGFGISVVFGVAIGLLMGMYRQAHAALNVYVNAFLVAPGLVFAPVFFSIFGLGRETVVAVIVMYAIFVIIVNTDTAVRNVPVPLVEMARSYGASNRKLFLKVILPAATPLTMAAIRIAAGGAIKGMVNGEMFIAITGLGAIVIRAGQRFDATTILAILMLMIVVSYALIGAVRFIDTRLTSWLPTTSR